MSKESQVFSMSDAEKIAKVLEIKGISLYDANRKLGLGQGTLHKIIQRKSGIHESTKEKFIRHFHVKHEWWETGNGDIFEEKLTVAKISQG